MRNQKVLTAAMGLGLVMVLSALAASTAPAAAPSPRETVRIAVLTCPLGCGIYEHWAIYERIFAQKHPWLRVASQETPGFIYNLKEMTANKARWAGTVFGIDEGTFQAGEYAVAPFFDKPTPSKPWKLLYPINGSQQTTWVWATFNPAIKTVKDFQGKRLGLGVRGQIAWGFMPTVWLEALGVKARNEYLGPLPALEALLDGRVDAAQVQVGIYKEGPVVTVESGITMERFLASGKTFYYVSWDPTAPNRLKEQKGYTGGYRIVEVPPGTLPKQEKPLFVQQTVNPGWGVHESFSEEIAYEFTKFMIQHGKELAKYVSVGRFMGPVKVREVFDYTEQNTHPGAIRAYKEFGLW